MIIDDKVLERLEQLSAIEIDESKKDELKAQLSEILDFVENLNAVKIPPNLTPKATQTPLREDVVAHSDVADEILKNAPKREERFFIVPKIIE